MNTVRRLGVLGLVCLVGQALAGQPARPAAQPAPSRPAPPQTAGAPHRLIVVNNALGLTIPKGKEGGLEVEQKGRGWAITGGEAKIKTQDIRGSNAGVDPKLQINRFEAAPDLKVIRLTLTPTERTPEFLKAVEDADKAGSPALVDSLGRRYQAVGFVYKDPTLTRVRYTRESPLEHFSEAPSVTRSAADRELVLIFVVSPGIDLKEFRIGDAMIERYDPPLATDPKPK